MTAFEVAQFLKPYKVLKKLCNDKNWVVYNWCIAAENAKMWYLVILTFLRVLASIYTNTRIVLVI